MSESTPSPRMTDDEILSFTQTTRKQLVDQITQNGMPDDPKDRTALLHALSDMDQTAINNKRLGAQQKTADADRMALLMIAKMNQAIGNRNPFALPEGQTVESGAVELDESRLPEVTPVEGEMDIGISTLTYDEFMREYED